MEAKRPVGKPKSPLTEPLWSRCTAVEKAKYQARADAEGRELSAHIRFCLNKYEESKSKTKGRK